MKTLKLGKPTVISLSGEAAESFVNMSKDEQISYLAERLSPSGDIVRAKQLLKGVPHGNISSGNEPKDSEDNEKPATPKSNGNGGARRKSGASESKD